MDKRIDEFSQTDITREVNCPIVEISGTKNMKRQQNDSHNNNFEPRCLVNINLDELKQKYLDGMSLRQLALKYDTSTLTIKRKLLKLGLIIRKDQNTIPSKSGFRTEINETKFIELHSKGLSTRDLMKEFNISSDLVIRRVYKRLGLNPNPTNISDKLAEMYQVTRRWDTYENLYELYINQEKSMLELSSICHAGDQTVRVALQRFGIPLRTLQEANKIAANKSESKTQRSSTSKQLWQDEEYREKIISKLIGSHPQMPPEHTQHVSEAMKLLYENNSYLERHCDRVRKLWENPTPLMLENLYQTIEAMQNKSSTIHQKFDQAIHTEEHLNNLSQQALNQWSNPTFLKDKLPVYEPNAQKQLEKPGRILFIERR